MFEIVKMSFRLFPLQHHITFPHSVSISSRIPFSLSFPCLLSSSSSMYEFGKIQLGSTFTTYMMRRHRNTENVRFKNVRIPMGRFFERSNKFLFFIKSKSGESLDELSDCKKSHIYLEVSDIFSRSRHGSMSTFFCVVLSCVGTGLAVGRSTGPYFISNVQKDSLLQN